MTTEEARKALVDAGWPSVAEDVTDGVPIETILRRLREIDEESSEAYEIVSMLDDEQPSGTKRRQVVMVVALDVPDYVPDENVRDEIYITRGTTRHPGPSTRLVNVEVLAVQDEHGETLIDGAEINQQQ